MVKTIFELEKIIFELSEKREALKKKLTKEAKSVGQSQEYIKIKNALNHSLRQKASLVLQQAPKKEGPQKDEKLFSLMQAMESLRLDLKLNQISCRKNKKYDALRKAISRRRAILNKNKK
jgi:hypothetical protein